MERERGFTRSIIGELHSWDIQRDQMEGESGVSQSIIDELHSLEIQREEMEGESGVIRNITDELHSLDIQRDQMEGEIFDGQYLPFSVPGSLTEVLDLLDQFIFSCYPLHKGGVLDNYIREDSCFSWLFEIHTI